MLGKTLGHYQITNQLGKGGMEEVWKARDTRLCRIVATDFLVLEWFEGKPFSSPLPENEATFDREKNSKNGRSFFLCSPAGLCRESSRFHIG